MLIVGVDPGLHGAACIYEAETHHVLAVTDMPVEPWGSKSHINVPEFMRWVHRGRADTAAIERVNAMPSIDGRRSMGAASAFRFGMVFGEVRGALIGAGLKIVDVPPTTWKDLFELRGRDKDDARGLAAWLHPEIAGLLTRKKDVGRGEAVLIARWAALDRWENR